MGASLKSFTKIWEGRGSKEIVKGTIHRVSKTKEVPSIWVVSLPSTFYQLSKRSLKQLTPEAQERLSWVNSRQTLRHRGMSASSAAEVLNLYRWAKAVREEGPGGSADQEPSTSEGETANVES